MHDCADEHLLAQSNISVFSLKPPRLVDDRYGTDLAQPTQHQRWTQEVEGYELTLVNGVATYRHGKPTGALPGTLVRNPRADASKYQNIAPQVSTSFDGWVRPACAARVSVEALVPHPPHWRQRGK